MKKVEIYDSTLRDGAQQSGLNLTRQDKFLITKNLIKQLEVPYIEVYPFSNPKDRNLIKFISENHPQFLNHLVAFGSTHRSDQTPETDPNLQSIVDSGLSHATIFGKTWLYHLDLIHATPDQNLQMITDSVKYLKDNEITVFYDAEHFFDGYKDNSEYAIETLKAAEKGGAEVLILCDTNGGTLPNEIESIIGVVLKQTTVSLGIHTHNDSGLGVANSIVAVKTCNDGGRSCQVQGTINGIGERTGNANLITIIPILVEKMGLNTSVPNDKLKNLVSLSHLLCEIINISPPDNAPFVGKNAFSHKGGMHIAAVKKKLKSYEHMDPSLVGNKRRFVVSEMAGKSALLSKFEQFGITLAKEDPLLETILQVLKRKESHGYTYDGADASLEILVRGMMENPKLESSYYRTYFFEVDYFRVITDVRNVFDKEEVEIFTDANIKLLIANPNGFHEFHTAADGNGPVNAIDKALKKALLHFYPILEEIELLDFKVRIANELEDESGTNSRVRVWVLSKDKDGQTWGTIGSHVNIMAASFAALIDSYVYKLMKENAAPYSKEKL